MSKRRPAGDSDDVIDLVDSDSDYDAPVRKRGKAADVAKKHVVAKATGSTKPASRGQGNAKV